MSRSEPATRVAGRRRAGTVPAVVAGVLLLAVATACGDDGGSEAIDSGPAEPEQTVTTTTAAEPSPSDDEGPSDGDGGRDDGGGQGDAPRVVDCDDEPSPSITGASETVAVVGSCDDVAISGHGHEVEVEASDRVGVSGSGHTVVVHEAGVVQIDGAGHDVWHPAGAVVENTSVDSHVATLDGGDGASDGDDEGGG